MNIQEFKKGDTITRTQPTEAGQEKFDPFNNIMVKSLGDYSYIGDKLIFVGIANGCAYFKRTGFEARLFGSELLDLKLASFEEGWEYYIDPQTLLDNPKTQVPMTKEQIKQAILKAVQSENYEKAEELKKQLKDLK